MRKHLVRAAVTCLLSATTAAAQSPAAKIVGDAAAALGGRDRVLAVKTLVMEGKGMLPTVGQGPDPQGPLNIWWVREYKRTIDVANGRMKVEQYRVRQFPFAQPLEFRETLAFDRNVAFNVDGTGKAVRAFGTAAQDRRIEMLGNPIVLMWAALHPDTKLANVRKSGGNTLVDMTNPLGDRLTLAFDDKTHLPASVSWMTPSANLGDVTNTTAFLDYETVSGIKLPKRYLTTIDYRNWVSQDIQIATYTLDAAIGDLAAPAAVTDAPAPPPREVRVDVVPVAKGIWYLQGTGVHYSSLLEFDDHTTLFEAPVDEARARAVIDTARKLVPGKPLTEVVYTHHHFDHTGGLRTAVAEGLTVIAHQQNEQMFREFTLRKATLQPDLLAKSPGRMLKFRGFDDQLELKDNTNHLVLYHVIDNDHAPYMLMGYAPREKIIFQGDMLVMGWDPQPWAYALARNIAMRKIDVAKDLPSHGRIATRDEELAAVAATITPK